MVSSIRTPNAWVVTSGAAALGLLVASGVAHADVAGVTPAPTPAEAANVVLAGPVEMRLTRETSIDLTITRSGPARAEQSAEVLRWRTNVGTLESLGPESLRYLPGPKHSPQVAIIAAYSARDKAPVVHFVQLIGSPTIEVNSEPNVNVMVEIAGASFGPQRTNSAGVALVPVEVPPGVINATTVATDSHGNVTREDLPLDPPLYPRVLTLCANGDDAVYVIEVDSRGQPASAPTFRLQADALITESPSLVQPGVFRIDVRPERPPTKTISTEVRAAVDGFTSSCSLELTPPPLALPYTLDGTVVPLEPSHPWFVGVTLGWLTNANRVSGPWAGLRGAYAFGRTHHGLRLELEAAYSQSSVEMFTTDNQTLGLELRTWPVFVNGRYILDWGIVHPMASISLGAAISRAEATGSNILTNENFVTPWLGGALGGMWWLGRHELAAEVGYTYAKHATGSVLGNVGGLHLTLAYHYGL